MHEPRFLTIAGVEASAPQAVTLDISLPDGSGIEVLKHIHKRGLNLFVVVLTGNVCEALRTKCQWLGAMAVLDKFNGLAQAAEALLAGRPDPQTRYKMVPPYEYRSELIQRLGPWKASHQSRIMFKCCATLDVSTQTNHWARGCFELLTV